jgi:3-dehydroquinate dehydratase
MECMCLLVVVPFFLEVHLSGVAHRSECRHSPHLLGDHQPIHVKMEELF